MKDLVSSSTAGRITRGGFSPRELRRYVAVQAVVFWGLILLCWVIYPAENQYSIMTHTFSFLGSFAAKHNPRGWWLFSVAMVFWGVSQAPLALYIGRRLSAVSRWGARAGAGQLLLGCLGIVFVGLFPDVRNPVAGSWRSTDIHEKATLCIVAGFIPGIPWCGALLLKDLLAARRRALPARRFVHKALLWPYLFWFAVVGVAVYFLAKWEFIYAEMRRAAAAGGAEIGSSWSEALNTRYAFPLWENIVVYATYLFLAWFALGLARDARQGTAPRGETNTEREYP